MAASASEFSEWAVRIEDIGSIRILNDGHVALTSADKLIMLDQDGKQVWQWSATEQIRCIAVDGMGAVYAAFGNTLAKLGSEGSVLWKADTYDSVYALEIIQGNVFIGWSNGLFVLDPDGNLFWEYYRPEDCWFPTLTGPVRSFEYLGDGKAIIVGSIYFDLLRLGPEDGEDFINLIDVSNGDTLAQFKAIEPFKIRQIAALSPSSVLVVADYAGIVRWNTRDKFIYDWRLKIKPPLYTTPIKDKLALAIGADKATLMLIDTGNGTLLKEITLPGKAIGNQLVLDSQTAIPIEGGMLFVDAGLQIKAKYSIPELTGAATLSRFGDSIYVACGNLLMKISLPKE
jgi:hypothetical protein